MTQKLFSHLFGREKTNNKQQTKQNKTKDARLPNRKYVGLSVYIEATSVLLIWWLNSVHIMSLQIEQPL